MTMFSTTLGVPAVFGALLAVAVIACAAPIISGIPKRVRIPAAVLEVLLGALAGPGGLNLVRPDEATDVLSFLGLGFLLFVAGLEVEPEATARHFKSVSMAFVMSVVIAVPIAYAVSTVEPINKPLLVAFALASTSLGVVIAVLDEKPPDHELDQIAIANSSVGEFGSLVLIAVFFSTSSRSIGLRVFTLAIFGAAVIAGALLLRGFMGDIDPRPFFRRYRRRTWQLDVRLALLILMVFAALAGDLGFDGILGTFAAGVLIRLSDRRGLIRDRHFTDAIDALGFGILIPSFFITSGISLDLRALFKSPVHVALVPIFFLSFVLCRGLPALFLWKNLGRKRSAAVGLMSATTLTVVIVAADAATSLHILDLPAATALVTAALLTEVLCPAGALALLGELRAPAPGATGTSPEATTDSSEPTSDSPEPTSEQ
jgi:Kef-type K+ transport system membrane component KefB